METAQEDLSKEAEKQLVWGFRGGGPERLRQTPRRRKGWMRHESGKQDSVRATMRVQARWSVIPSEREEAGGAPKARRAQPESARIHESSLV